MENFTTSHKMTWTFATIGIIAVAIIVILAMVMPKKNPATNTPANQQGPVEITKKNIDPAELPPMFDSDFPVESGSPILLNELQTLSDGRAQATRSFETKKTLAENFKLYSDYFKANNWIITDTIDQAGYKVIGATRSSLSARVELNDNTVTKQKTVDIFISRASLQPQ
jgi:hypothetical protein